MGLPVAAESLWASYKSWNRAFPEGDWLSPVMGRASPRVSQATDIINDTKISSRSDSKILPTWAMKFRSSVGLVEIHFAGRPARRTPLNSCYRPRKSSACSEFADSGGFGQFAVRALFWLFWGIKKGGDDPKKVPSSPKKSPRPPLFFLAELP